MSHVTLRATVGVTTQKLPNGETVPAFNVPSVYIDLPKDHLSIHIHGNIVSKIANAFKSLFEGKIRDAITSNLKSLVQKQLAP